MPAFLRKTKLTYIFYNLHFVSSFRIYTYVCLTTNVFFCPRTPPPTKPPASPRTPYTAFSVRSIVRPIRVRPYGNVYVDVHRRPVFTQCCHGDRVPGSFSAHLVRHTRLGRPRFLDHHLGHLNIIPQTWTKVI